jgi:hypothetical protein
VRWVLIIAGVALAATDNLTTWWGIAIIAVVLVLGLIAGLAETESGWGGVRWLIVNPLIAVGLFVGNGVADEVGAIVGGVAGLLVGAAIWAGLAAAGQVPAEPRDLG